MLDLETIKKELLSFLNERPDREYTTTQITSILGLKNSYRVEIQALLNMLNVEGYVTKRNKRYAINPDKMSGEIELTPPDIDQQPTEPKRRKSEKTVTGKFDATSLSKNLSHAYIVVDEGTDVLVSAEDTLNAYHGDMVEVKIIRTRNDKRYGVITKILSRNKTRFAGMIETVKKKSYFRSDNFKIHTLFEVTDTLKATSSQKVLVEVINWGLRSLNKLPVCKVVEILGEAGDQEIEVLSVIKEFDLPLEFPAEAISQAKKLSMKMTKKELAQRTDLRDLYTITIDPISAKDYDDAVSLIEEDDRTLTLYVHIADVAHYILPDSAVWTEAANRGNSYYFPNNVIPMLPEILSNKLCSLRPDEDKLTITVQTTFKPNGSIKSQKIYQSITCSNARLAYEEVDDYFENRKHNFSTELCSTIDRMRSLSHTLSQKRTDNGYLKFDLPEREFVYDDEGKVIDIKQSIETESHTLVENFMLVANEYVAKLLKKATSLTMYRIHEEPDEKDFVKIRDMLKAYNISFKVDKESLNKTWQNALECLPSQAYHQVFDRMILRSMKKAKYSYTPLPHFGLGINTYTHFTSPIRRLCDLVVHTLLKESVFKVRKEELPVAYILGYSKVATDKEVIADESERLVEKKIINTFMRQHLGQCFSAIINGMNSSSIFIELQEYPIRGVIKLGQLNDDYYDFLDKQFIIKGKRTKKMFRLCDKIEVILFKVDDDLYFLPQNSAKKENKVSKKTPRRKRK
ncbi:MAG: VacB/RNase II family 3'-5' exoribonuclease [Candidatus Cloacimonetes bacterium]|nr:VacB/RNase II family 3'-5' exoribonuclease [Candidatus Cloacimonadota bacterium]